MLELSQAELISAYVDGELNPDERSAAEQLLADNPQARQLSEDLKTLRRQTAALPRHHLPEGFAADVLRTAEREILLGGPSVAGVIIKDGTNHTSSDQPAPAKTDRHARSRFWRPAVWFVSGAAAAVLTMIAWPYGTEPGPANHIQVVQSPQPGNEELKRQSGTQDTADELKSASETPSESTSPGTGGNLEKGLRDRQTEASADADVRPLAAVPNTPQPEDDSEPLLRSELAEAAAEANEETAPAEEEADFVFVQLKLTAEAARQLVIADVLRNNEIELQEASLSPTEFDGAMHRNATRQRAASAGRYARDAVSAAAVSDNNEIMILDTSPEQLVKTLEQLRDREGITTETSMLIPETFFSLATARPMSVPGGGAGGAAVGLSDADAADGVRPPGVAAENARAGKLPQERNQTRALGLARENEGRSWGLRLPLTSRFGILPLPPARGAEPAPADRAADADDSTPQEATAFSRLAASGETATLSDSANLPDADRRVRSFWVLRVTPAMAPPASEE